MSGCVEGEALLEESERLNDLAAKAFKASVEEKLKYLQVKGVSLFGYKEAGTIKKTDKDLRPDTTEFFNVAKDYMHGVAPSRDYPQELLAQALLLKGFTKDSHTYECWS
jgi:isopenicillin N synthase-like dioxygenase